MKHELCKQKDCFNFGKYCRRPGHLTPAPSNKRVITVIAKVAEGRKDLNKEYKKRYKKEKGNKTKCEIGIPGVCTGKIQGYNHPAGKHSTELLLDLNAGQFCCNACNMWAEAHHEEAIKTGLITKRNTKKERVKVV